jgi:hypothetical protein
LSKVEGTEALPSPSSLKVNEDYLTMYLPSKGIFIRKHVESESIKIWDLG